LSSSAGPATALASLASCGASHHVRPNTFLRSSLTALAPILPGAFTGSSMATNGSIMQPRTKYSGPTTPSHTVGVAQLSIALGQWPGPLVRTSRFWSTITFQVPAWIPPQRPPIADSPLSKRLLLTSTPVEQLRSPNSLLLTFRSTSTCNFVSSASTRPGTAHGAALIRLSSGSTTV
jgi:hypothetical protein